MGKLITKNMLCNIKTILRTPFLIGKRKRLEKIIKSFDTIVFKEILRFTREAGIGYKKNIYSL